MYAVIETGGKQLRVREGDVIRVERLDVAPGAEVQFERVLCLGGDGRWVPGHPTVPGAVVVGQVEDQARAGKVVVFRYKAKVNYRRKTGHRQPVTVVRITGIRYGGAEAGAAAPAAGAPAGHVAGVAGGADPAAAGESGPEGAQGDRSRDPA